MGAWFQAAFPTQPPMKSPRLPRILRRSAAFALAGLLPVSLGFALTATPSTTEGPYDTLSSANTLDKTIFTGEAGDNNLLFITSGSTQASGTVQKLSGTLVNTSGVAIAGALIELWEADNNGIYYYVSSSSGTNNYANRDKNFQHFGTCTTDSSGAWSFLTVRPGLYVGRIRHFHLKIKIGGTLYLTTQLMPQDEVTATPSDNIVASLGSSVSLCTYTPTTGTITWGSSTYTGLLATKQLVLNYTVTATAPTITAEPSSVTATLGGSAAFSVIASGTGTLSYQWYKGAVGSGSAISGATSASYTISPVAAADAGTYYVIVTNSAGSDTSAAATLTVNAVAPGITGQPSSQTVDVGASASFTVVASGTSPLAYQWYKGSSALDAGTAATYSIASAATSHAGSYYVVVSNGAGSATSNTVTLSVTEPYSTFLATYGLGSSTADADPDGDGIPNLLEFVLGGDPTANDPSIQPTASYATVDGSPALVFSFYAVTSLGSVGWSVEYSSDLATWTTAAAGSGGITIATAASGAGVNLVTVTVPTTESRLMARLRLTLP